MNQALIFSLLFSPSSPTNFIPPASPYTLDQGDVIRVNIFGLPEQGGTDEVFTDGTVTFPLIGNVNVQGLTIAQVNLLMTELYSRFLKRPIITVTLEQARPLSVAIVGEVNSPGYYNIPRGGEIRTFTDDNTEARANVARNPKLTDLFALAGGLTVSADVKEIKLKRTQDQQQIVYTLNLWKLLQEGDLAQNIDLQDGDIITVSKQDEINPLEYQQLTDANFGIRYTKAPRVAIVGEVNRPGAYTVPIEEGLPRLTNVIQLSGGIKELADIRNITVTRTTRDTQQRTIEVNLWDLLQTGNKDNDIIVREGDVINIPRAEIIDPSEARTLATANFAPDEIAVYVVGTVVNPGSTSLQPNTSLNNAIMAAGGFDQNRANKNRVELIRFNDNGTVSKRDITINLAAEVNEQNNPILKNNDVVIVNRNLLATVGDTLGLVLAPFTSVFSFLRLFNVIR